jgi:hypothetical protein
MVWESGPNSPKALHARNPGQCRVAGERRPVVPRAAGLRFSAARSPFSAAGLRFSAAGLWFSAARFPRAGQT